MLISEKEAKEAIEVCETLKRCFLLYSDETDNINSGKAIETVLEYIKQLEKDLYSTNQLVSIYIEQNKCLHCGSNVAGYCEECYQELIGENAKLQKDNKHINKKYKDVIESFIILIEELKKYKENALFICDPDKNKECKKTSCYINNGECMQTNNINFAAGIDKGSGEDKTAFVRFIPETLIKFKLAEAEKEYKDIHTKHYRNCRTLEAILKAKIEAYKELLKEESK